MKCSRLSLCAAAILAAPTSRAVILYSTPDRNTLAPTGTLSTAGWQYEGNFGGFASTPIAANLFISAQHIGGYVGETFNYNGHNYITTSYWSDPHSDLRIWEVNSNFSTYAPMWNTAVDGSEAGKPMITFGHGTQRGAPIYSDGAHPEPQPGAVLTSKSPLAPKALPSGQSSSPQPQTVVTETTTSSSKHLAGWAWGPSDGLESWGTNTVYSIYTDPTLGPFVTFEFSQFAPNQSMLSAGDSAGGVFVDSNGVWKLAAVNYGVDSPWSETAAGPFEDGSVFNASGLYTLGANNKPFLIPNTQFAQPTFSYSTELAGNSAWINSVLGQAGDAVLIVPEPASMALIAGTGLLALRRRRRAAL